MAPLVPKGTPIAVVAPCHAYDPARLEAGLAIARAHGHDLRPFPDLLQPRRYFAAPLAHRLDQLVQALSDDEHGAVWIVRGGSGMLQLLPHIPWERVRNKPVIGFSDVVALHLALARRGGGPAVHGPVLHSLPYADAESVAHLFALLAGEPVPALSGETWAPGAAEGPLIGGNLCLLAATCGTPFQVDAKGALLVLEDVGELPYRVDRNLQQLSMAGVFDGVAGIVAGTFEGCDPPPGARWTLREVLMDHLDPLGVPVLGGLPIGHGTANRAFVQGARARVEGGRLTWPGDA